MVWLCSSFADSCTSWFKNIPWTLSGPLVLALPFKSLPDLYWKVSSLLHTILQVPTYFSSMKNYEWSAHKSHKAQKYEWDSVMSAWNGTCPISVGIMAPNIHLQLSVLMTKYSPRNSWLPRIFKSFVTEDPQKDLCEKVRQSLLE